MEINPSDIKSHLQTISIDEDDGYEANNASYALDQVRRMFRNTPYEELFDKAIQVCDIVATFVEEQG